MVNLHSSFKNKKILITGNTGFKGAWLSLCLKELGAKVFGYSEGIVSQDSLFVSAELEKEFETVFADICDYDNLFKYISKIEPHFIFHLAAQSIVSQSYKEPISTLKTNAIGTANILESLRNVNLENKITAIIITSDKCYENVEQIYGYRETDRLGGIDPYSASKACAELIASSFIKSYFRSNEKVRIGIARAGNVIGGGDWTLDRIVPDCYRCWTRKQPVSLRAPESTRPWQHVLEPIFGYLIFASRLCNFNELNNGETFNFGPSSNNVYSVLDLANELSNRWKMRRRNIFNTIDDNNSHEELFHEAALLQLDITKARNHLEWWPLLSFKEICDYTSEWYLNYIDKKIDIKKFTMEQVKKYRKSMMDNGLESAT